MIPRAILGLALVSLALPAVAEGTLVTLVRDGAPVANGEVCRFPAGDREDPFRRWLASQDVTCAPSGSRVVFPPGLWNVFARVEGKAVSDPIVVDGNKAPERLSLSLNPGATLMPRLAEGTSAVVYVPHRAVAYPFNATMQHVTVPAGEELWVIVIEKNEPAGILKLPAIEAGTERATGIPGGTGGPFLLGWIQVPAADRAALIAAQGLSMPHVHFTSHGSSRDTEPLSPAALLNGSFYLVRGVPSGDAELDIGGRGWVPYQARVKIDSRLMTVVNGPLTARLGASIFVEWSVADNLVALDHNLGSCGGSGDDFTPVVISISVCASKDPESCRVLRHEAFAPQPPFGTFTVDDLPPGKYRAELHFGKLPPIVKDLHLSVLLQQRVRLHAQYFEISGTLTFGGKPLGDGVKMKFPADGIGFASAESGDYQAVLLMPICEDTRVDVASCAGGIRAFGLTGTGKPDYHNDIDIPDNRLTIHVVDTFTGTPVDAATVHYTIMSKAVPRRPVIDGELKGARVGLTAVPVREIRLLVTCPGYRKQTIEPFMMPSGGEKAIDVELWPLQGSQGRILSPLPFVRASVYWYNAEGTLTESAELDPDGSFVYVGQHGPDETMAVISSSHPLWVTRAPPMPRHETFKVAFPSASARDFSVIISNAKADVMTYIGLFVGGVRVPYAALSMYQALRKEPSLVRGPGPLHIGGLVETGPIDVVLGPLKDDVPRRLGLIDPLVLPQFAGAPRKRLGPGVGVIALER